MDKSYPIEIAVPRTLPDGVQIDARPIMGSKNNEYVVVTADGKDGPARMRFSEMSDASGKYTVQAGQYEDGNGKSIDLLVYTDPLPAPVAIGLGAALICGALAMIDKWTSDCSAELSTTINACTARGGIPVFHGFVTVAFNIFEGSFGCSFQCVWDRCDIPPAGASAFGPATTSTTTSTHPDGSTTTITTTSATPTVPVVSPKEVGTEAIFDCGDVVLGVGSGSGKTSLEALAAAEGVALTNANKQCPKVCPAVLEGVIHKVPFQPVQDGGFWHATFAGRYRCKHGS